MRAMFAHTACQRMRLEGGCRRDYLRARAQRVEAADDEIIIMVSKGALLRPLAAIGGTKKLGQIGAHFCSELAETESAIGNSAQIQHVPIIVV